MIKTNLKAITSELASVIGSIDETQTEEVVKYIVNAPRIYVKGVGRSGFMMEAFAMRLMHLGFNVHVIGNATTPGARKGDLLIVGTGSGETGGLISYANKARKIGLKMITVTSFVDSTLGEMADVVLRIPSPTPKSTKISEITSIQPMGTLFEQSLLICLDILIMDLMESKSANAEQMFGNHANLE
ncbi:6-phospho-3-hexuloisomerase [Neobacillus niacini]|uniref:6-phospho-3-hexuloisomerase n=1 Tax=Neobacillus niacini TaxID=86668 RepID=UPI00203E59C2|nr:6-phospho-3-hexuloisomerase [Neobacillus niacini]MCM3693912.1 6-phospho-3-hexuloisomerase [Neobacillus niacini]